MPPPSPAQSQMMLDLAGPKPPLTDVYSTRFQGSKRRVLPWLIPHVLNQVQPGASVLDAFAGSGVVSYALARNGLDVTSCDRLLSSVWSVRGFVVDAMPITDVALSRVVEAGRSCATGELLDIFAGIFFPDDELCWLEGASDAIRTLPESERGLLYWALFQSALAKRPYNLFHRSNLSMRTREVKRSFGNKATWEKPFADHMRKFAAEANRFVLDSPSGAALEGDPLGVDGSFDLVYLDPPYINGRGVPTPYNDYYGFLDLLVDSGRLGRIDYNRPHRPMDVAATPWEKKHEVLSAFEAMFERFNESHICISYRSDGIPTIDQIVGLLSKFKSTVDVTSVPISYALSKGTSEEVLIIGR